MHLSERFWGIVQLFWWTTACAVCFPDFEPVLSQQKWCHLHEMCGLPLPVRRSAEPVSRNFLNKFSVPLCFCAVLIRKFPNHWPSTVASWFPKFSVKILSSLVIILNNLPVIYLNLRNSDVMFTSRIKHINSLFAESIHSCFRNVKKILKIHQDFPELWSQMYCHL